MVKLGCDTVKIPSFDTIILSGGTSTFDEIKQSVKLIDKSDLFLMHCVSVYPGEYFEANLPKMKKYRSICDKIGLSDHIQGVESSKIAIGEGAVIIEKHFTIDKDLPGRDNKFSILPAQLKDLSDFINNRELMLEDQGLGFSNKEIDSRQNYTGRFDG